MSIGIECFMIGISICRATDNLSAARAARQFCRVCRATCRAADRVHGKRPLYCLYKCIHIRTYVFDFSACHCISLYCLF